MAERWWRPEMDNANGSPMPEGYGALDEPGSAATHPPASPQGHPADRPSAQSRPTTGRSAGDGSSSANPPEGGTLRERFGRTAAQYGINARFLKRVSGIDRPSGDPGSSRHSSGGTDVTAGGQWGGPLTDGPVTIGANGGHRDSPGSDGGSHPDNSPGNGAAEDESGLGAPVLAAGVATAAASGLSASPTQVPLVGNQTIQVIPPNAGRAPTEAIPLPTSRRGVQGRGAVVGSASAPTTSRIRPESRSQEETLVALDSMQPGRGWRRQKVRVIRSTSSRRMVRRVDTWTVFKVSLFFYLLGLAVLLVAGVILWNVATTFGTISSLEKSIRSLFDLTNFTLKPRPLLEYSAAGGIILALLGTIMNTVAALLYNLISDIAGGIQIIVVTEPD
jgi:Transmembrane domain of unknown function (DUF3566)